jgi:hypothetical protein
MRCCCGNVKGVDCAKAKLARQIVSGSDYLQAVGPGHDTSEEPLVEGKFSGALKENWDWDDFQPQEFATEKLALWIA